MYNKIWKRVLDIVLALAALPFVAIALAIFAPIIHFTDGGPVFYNASRLGKEGKPFKMYKLRSMFVNAPDIRNEDGSTYNGDDDPRVTPVGRFMRKTSIDELPQILNVLKGDMSWIGPRPDPLDDMQIYTPHQKQKLKVRPGITGYSQAYFRNAIEQNQKFENDVTYAQNVSFLFDVKILLKTVQTVLCKDNVYNDTATQDENALQEIERIKVGQGK